MQTLKTLGRRLGWQIPAIIVALSLGYYSHSVVNQEPLSFRLPATPSKGKSALYYPTGAVAYIQEHGLGGKILTDFDWGEYLIWTLAPRCQISLDGRYETVYPSTVSQAYFDFINARPQWRQFLAKYPPGAPKVEIDPKSDLAALPYTGGTTGLPKAAMLTHSNLVSLQQQVMAFWPFMEEGNETVMAFLPFFHIYGQVVLMLGGLTQGHTIVLFTTPDLDEILNAVER